MLRAHLAAAALNFAGGSAGMRHGGPLRSFTSVHCACAHSRTAVLFSPLPGGPAFVRAGRGTPLPRASRSYAACQRVWQPPGMLGVRVDLILRAVRAELDGIVSLAAVQVTGEQRLYLLGHHVCSVPVGGLGRISIPHRLEV